MSLLLLNTTGRILLVNYSWVLDHLLLVLGRIVALFIRLLLVVKMMRLLLLCVVLIDIRLLIL